MVDDDAAFPQDQATGLQDTIDWNDAGGFAWLAHHPNTCGHVIEGFDMSVGWSSEVLTIDGGVANLYQSSTQTNDHSDDEGPDEIQLEEVMFRVQRGPSGDISLASGTTYVWVTVDQTENNTVDFIVGQDPDNDEPDEPFVRIGHVDTDDEEIVEENRRPTIEVDRVLVTNDT